MTPILGTGLVLASLLSATMGSVGRFSTLSRIFLVATLIEGDVVLRSGSKRFSGDALRKTCVYSRIDRISERSSIYPRIDVDSRIDVRAIFQQPHRDLDFMSLPPLLRPAKGRFSLTDYEKAFCLDLKAGDIFNMRGLDRQSGAAVVVRPDQFVAGVTPLADHRGLASFFEAFMRPQR